MTSQTTDPLSVYLRNHEAAARGGVQFFGRVAGSQRRRPYGTELARLAGEVREDHRRLLDLMRGLGVRPDPVLGVAAVVGERVGRLKPNGRLLRRAPLTDLIEVEGLRAAVLAKAGAWQALLAADDSRRAELEDLAARADDQREHLDRIHRTVAGEVLTAT